jgi:hypothetical protein
MQNVRANIRLFSEDLLEYRLMALEEGQSLSTYIRDIIRIYADSKKQRNFEVLLERDCLIHRKICYHMPVLFKDLSYPFKYPFLFRMCC